MSGPVSVEYDYFEKDNAIFRRPRGGIGRWVQDVYRPRTGTWEPYKGDCLAPAVFGDRCEDPKAERR